MFLRNFLSGLGDYISICAICLLLLHLWFLYGVAIEPIDTRRPDGSALAVMTTLSSHGGTCEDSTVRTLSELGHAKHRPVLDACVFLLLSQFWCQR